MERDILKDSADKLKKMPYDVPKGYFNMLGNNLEKIAAPQKKSAYKKFIPYAALAASFLLLVTIGTFFLKSVTPSDTLTDEDLVVFARIIPTTDPMAIYYSQETESESLTEDDIIEYLIYNDFPLESLELIK
jgi:hypothetical protein